MATYKYKGAEITGTSTTAKVFKNSGVKSAVAGDYYLNRLTGHVYKCTVGGAPKAAKWKYMKTDIVGPPEVGVNKLALKRNGYKMEATWAVPSKLTDKQNGRRATALQITWQLIKAGKDPIKAYIDKKESDTAESINLNNVKFGSTKYTRESFYPFSGKPKLSSVSVMVQPRNTLGFVDWDSVQYVFEKPRKPSIGSFSFNTETGVVSVTITTNAGTDKYERYDTKYKMTVTDTRTGKTRTDYDSHSTSTSSSLTFNVSDYQQFTYSQYAKITVEAYARGFKGDSDTVKSTYYVGYPAQATIKGVDISGTTSSDKCTVRISTNSTTAHPVDRVRLEYLANVSYSKASDIPGDAAWESTDIIDDAKCSALAMGVSNLIPDRGNHTWVRVKSWHLSEAVLYRYSAFMEVKMLYISAPTAADDKITIISATPGTDGKSIVVVLGWNEAGTDDSTGTELTWADSENAWKSTKDPDAYEFTWSDGRRTAGGKTYRDSATITIKDLDDGTKYFIRARRYLEGDTISYSPYSNSVSCFTSEAPEAIVATCGRYVAKGASLPVYWTFSGNGLQKNWQIVASNGTVIASGQGSIGATQIQASRLSQFASNGSITFTVQASTGSGFVVSEAHTVTIVDNPVISLGVISPLTVQPMSFSVTASTLCDLVVIVSSAGASGQFPDGMKRQAINDTIHSEICSPVWSEGANGYTATVELPGGLDFWDGCRYQIVVTAIDRETELRSEEITALFDVAWAHQAPSVYPAATYTLTADAAVDPDVNYYTYDSVADEYTVVDTEGGENPASQGWYTMTEIPWITLEAIDTTDDQGVHHQAMQITLVPPANSLTTDVYDIYRLTGDGAYLIGESFPLECVTTDEYAPFGSNLTLYYRIAIRTADGDVEFGDFEYTAEGSNMRFDWAGGSLELPYNPSVADKYKKDVDVRSHMDGTTDAYWNQNIKRSASFNSDLIYLEQQPEIVSARQLARYAGAVFVRLPDGSAYEADVQVTDLSSDGRMTAIALDATEVGLTDEFILPTPFEVNSEG